MLYGRESGRTKKPRTLPGDRDMIEGHINPLIGRLAVGAVTARLVTAQAAAIAFVARTGSFSTLHNMLRLASRGRLRSVSHM